MNLLIDLKPELEWVEANGRHFADIYEIKQTPNGKWILMWTIDHDHYHNTLSEAKAAAQADYERRTAERFRPVKVPSKHNYQDGDSPDVDIHIHGYNTAIDALESAIAKARKGVENE